MRVKKNCISCSNKVTKDYCTMQKDMQKAMFRLCDGWTVAPKNVRLEKLKEDLSQREERIVSKLDFGTDWERFIQCGGHYSFLTKKYV